MCKCFCLATTKMRSIFLGFTKVCVMMLSILCIDLLYIKKSWYFEMYFCLCSFYLSLFYRWWMEICYAYPFSMTCLRIKSKCFFFSYVLLIFVCQYKNIYTMKHYLRYICKVYLFNVLRNFIFMFNGTW